MSTLQGTAIVTGVSRERGIGRAVARQLIKVLDKLLTLFRARSIAVEPQFEAVGLTGAVQGCRIGCSRAQLASCGAARLQVSTSGSVG